MFKVWFIRAWGEVNEKVTASFDNKYVYTQLSSEKKTICTVVILENKESGRDLLYSLPYFRNRDIREIAWGLSSNDLFVDYVDSGLTVYRNMEGTWTACYLNIVNNPDGTYTCYLHDGSYGEYRDIYHELSVDTIPHDIKTRISKRFPQLKR